MLKLDETDGIAPRRSRTLSRIATALGRPVSTFSEPSAEDLDKTTELLRLWVMIHDDQDRAKVLAFVRSAATGTAWKEATGQRNPTRESVSPVSVLEAPV